MAKKPETNGTTEISIKDEGGMPAFLRSYQGPTGTDNIDAADLNIPRIKLGQGLTPEVKEGLVKDGDMFHSITKEVLIPNGQFGRIIPVCYMKEFILWKDQNFEGGGILARAQRVIEGGNVRYKWDNANQEFQNKIKGLVSVKWKTGRYIDEDHLDQFGTAIPGDKESGPAATAHYNYILCLPDHDNAIVAISFSRSSAKKARDLNAMLKMGSVPMFARQFALGSVAETNDASQQYYNYTIRPAGFVLTEEMFNRMKSYHEELSQASFRVDFDGSPDIEKSSERTEKEQF